MSEAEFDALVYGALCAAPTVHGQRLWETADAVAREAFAAPARAACERLVRAGRVEVNRLTSTGDPLFRVRET
jgi:hypothetical protein